MNFRTRNSYYLKISEKCVLPTYIYLDERHLGWMSDRVLQHVLADIRPHIISKLRAEADTRIVGGTILSKKLTVNTHRGETYQFCYFIRKTEPHSVVVKQREFTLSTKPQALRKNPQASTRIGKRRNVSENHLIPPATSKKRRTVPQHGGNGESGSEQTGEGPFRSYSGIGNTNSSSAAERHLSRAANNDGDDMEMIGDSDDSIDMSDTPAKLADVQLDIDIEEEEKPKPILHLKYHGFSIYGHCLCIVVEPWPTMRSGTRSLSVALGDENLRTRNASITPNRDIFTFPDARDRQRTPLFLPDNDEGNYSQLPALNREQLPFVTSDTPTYTIDDDDDESDICGMLEYSQVLNSAGDFRPGAADDNEDLDGDIFFGDADEIREF